MRPFHIGPYVAKTPKKHSLITDFEREGPHWDVWDDQALSRYPVLKIHPTAAMHTIKKAMIMPRLIPALISEVS